MRDLSGIKIDRYMLVNLIGWGAFGQVYKAKEDGKQDFCAVKILIPDPDKPSLLSDFVREIRTIFRLTHPNIVRLRDFSIIDLPGFPEPLAFFVMDYCASGTLRKRHRPHQQVPLPTIVPYVKQIAAALQHVHDQDKVHRDVKPENLLVGDQGEILLSDFGITTHAYTRDKDKKLQLPLGTLYYMSPEQLDGKAGRRSDQYALGIIVYEWLLGAVPFTGNTQQIIYQQKYVNPASLQQHVAGLSADVEAVIMRALKKDPDERFEHIIDFSEALENAAMIAQTTLQGPHRLTYTGHEEGVSTVAWSPNGQVIASGSGNGIVSVWEAMTLRQYHRLNEHIGIVRGIAWSPDGSQFATADQEGLVFIWNAQNGKPVQQWSAQESVRSLAWHPYKPCLLTAGSDGAVRFWNTTTGALTSVYQTYATMVDAIAWSPDGSLFACGCDDNSVRVLEDVTYRYRSFYAHHTSRVASITWLPIGARQYIASAGYDCTIQIWDVVTQELFTTYKEHSDPVVTLAWSPTGRYLASGSCDKTVRIWEVATGACVQHYQHDQDVSGVTWSPDSHYIASSSWDGTVQIHALDAHI